MVAASIANLSNGGDRLSEQSANLQSGSVSRAEAAEKLNVSERTASSTTTIKAPQAKPRVKSVDRHELDYQRKLSSIKADIRCGAIDRLTLAIGRDRYSMRDSRTRRAQRELCKAGLLVRQGRRCVVSDKPVLRLVA